MSLEKDFEVFKNAAETRKKVFDEAVEFYNGDSFRWEKYPETDDTNAVGKTKTAVYAFFVENPRKHVDKILTAVGNIKTNQKNNGLPKINKNCKESFKENGCLYIGSVTSETIGNRMKGHWRVNHEDVGDGTYALKLYDWFGEAEISKDDITVYFCNMAGQKVELVRAVEDCLAAVYYPLLGKRGDSPKG